MSIEFEECNVDDAIAFVVEHGAMDRASTISYSRVFGAAGLPAPQDLYQSDPQSVTTFMRAFHDRCLALSLPPLDALVVRMAGDRQDRPGPGYFAVNGHADPFSGRGDPVTAVKAQEFWEQQQREVEGWGERFRRSGAGVESLGLTTCRQEG